MRDRVSADEIAHDLSQNLEFEKLKDEYIDQAESGDLTDWIDKEWAHELLAELAWMLYAPSHKVHEAAGVPLGTLKNPEFLRLSEMRGRCQPYIDKWADKQAKKELDL